MGNWHRFPHNFYIGDFMLYLSRVQVGIVLMIGSNNCLSKNVYILRGILMLTQVQFQVHFVPKFFTGIIPLSSEIGPFE